MINLALFKETSSDTSTALIRNSATSHQRAKQMLSASHLSDKPNTQGFRGLLSNPGSRCFLKEVSCYKRIILLLSAPGGH